MIYPFSVYMQTGNNKDYWVAKSANLKGCVGQGDTADEAIKELENNEHEWLETAKQIGIEIPKVPIVAPETYSGKFTVRIAPIEHCRAVENAHREHISLNQYVSDAIVARNSLMNTRAAGNMAITDID